MAQQVVKNMSNDSYTITRDKAEESGFPPLVRHIYVGYYAIIFLMATFGNLFAIFMCYKNFKITSTILLTYIASLAVADLLFTLLTPLDLAAFLASSWISGQFMCRFQSFLIETSYTTSVLTLAMISRERLVAVTTPLLARSQRIKQRKFIPFAIWLIAIASCSPLLYAYIIVKDHNSASQCVNIGWGDSGRQVYYTIQGILLFLCPLMYMIYSHYRIFRVLKQHGTIRRTMSSKLPGNQNLQQRRITKMLAVVTCVFVACYFPFALVRSLKYFYVFNHGMLWRLVQLMIFTQAAVNPIVYCFYSKQFRAVVKDLIRCRWHKAHFRERNHTFRTRSSSEACPTVKLEALHSGKDLSTLAIPSPKRDYENNPTSSVWL